MATDIDNDDTEPKNISENNQDSNTNPKDKE